MEKPRNCTVENCKNPQARTGLCYAHYQRKKRHGTPFGGRTPNGKQREWVERHIEWDADECLIWPYSRPRGYGYCHIGGKFVSVSRYMCEQRQGPPQEPNLEAAHLCGNGHLGCVNPKHLKWKTSKQNKEDQLVHGTRQRGTLRPTAKLDADAVRRIRTTYSPREFSYRKIADEYGVSPEAIYSVVKRRTWKWLE